MGSDNYGVTAVDFVLSPGEYINEVHGRAGELIDMIGFKTTMGRSQSFGTSHGGHHFSLQVAGKVVKGFRVGFGGSLHFIGVHFGDVPASPSYGGDGHHLADIQLLFLGTALFLQVSVHQLQSILQRLAMELHLLAMELLLQAMGCHLLMECQLHHTLCLPQVIQLQFHPTQLLLLAILQLLCRDIHPLLHTHQ